MALNDRNIEIAEKYLSNIAEGIYNRVKAVEEIHPTIANKKSYAYKLWRNKEFRLYLAERSKELMADRYNFKELADASMNRVREMLAIEEREIVEFSSKECSFETMKGFFPDSKEALGFTEIFKRFSKIAMEADELKAVLDEEAAERENKKFTEVKKNNKLNQKRSDDELEKKYGSSVLTPEKLFEKISELTPEQLEILFEHFE